VLPRSKNFLNFKELVFFVVVFTIFMFAVFPKHILPKLLKDDYSETSIKYLENLLNYYHTSNIAFLLIDKYLRLGEYDKAKKLLSKQKKGYKRYLYEYLLVKNLYFQKRSKLINVEAKLFKLFRYADDNKKREFIYKESRAFNFNKLAFWVLKYLDKPEEYINLALYFKKYNLAIDKLIQELNKKFNEKYFNKLIDIALYRKKTDIANKISMKYYSLIRTKKGYQNLLLVGLLAKNNFLIKKSIDKVDNLKLKLQGYLALKDYNNALKIAKSMNNYHLIAQIYLWNNDYQNALNFFLKDGFEKNIKVITSLAYILKKYSLLEKILLSKIKKGDYSKVKDLTYAYQSGAEYEKGIKVYKKLYKKTENDIFLKELFKLYYDLGDDENIKNLVWKFKKLPLNIALYASELYMSQRDYKSAYKIMKKVKSDKYEYYEKVWFLANKLGYEKEELKALRKMQSIKITPQNVLALYILYLKKDKYSAFEYLKNNYAYSETLFYELLKLAYELKKYRFIINLKPQYKSDFYYVFLIKAYTALKKYKKVKEIYKEAIKKYPQLQNDYFWFLISQKDKSIRKYLHKIKDKNILLAAYLVLSDKYRALKILKEILKEDDNIKRWIEYYYLSNDQKARFLIYKKIDALIANNKTLLFNSGVLDFYFYNALYYKNAPFIRKLLCFIKKHRLNYDKYYIMYAEHFQEFERLKGIIK